MRSFDHLLHIIEARAALTPQEGVALAGHTSFAIGGPAALFAAARSTEELAALVAAAFGEGVATIVLGGGTNLLVSDEGFEGLVIKPVMTGMEIDEERAAIRVGASVLTADLVERAVEAGLAGLEFAAGLPGTVGGALAGNAGCFGRALSDALEAATVVTPQGEILAVGDARWFGFDYRHSRLLDEGGVIAEAVFGLRRGNPDALRAESSKRLAERATRHPPRGARTAGSYFKNLPPEAEGGQRVPAGLLLDRAGVHGLAVGDAAVFERHANIIVNRGSAAATDVLALADEMARLVREKFGVDLSPEVRFVGRRPEGFGPR